MNPQARTRHKLHHSLVALLAVAVVSALSLLVARPLPAPADGVALLVSAEAKAATGVLLAAEPQVAIQATEDALEITVESAVDELEAGAAPEPRKPRKPIRRSRQTLAMPYFSFAARS